MPLPTFAAPWSQRFRDLFSTPMFAAFAAPCGSRTQIYMQAVTALEVTHTQSQLLNKAVNEPNLMILTHSALWAFNEGRIRWILYSNPLLSRMLYLMCKVLTSQVFTSTLKLLTSRPDDTLTQQDDEQQTFLQVSMLTGIGLISCARF